MAYKGRPGYREISEYYEHLIRTGKLAPGTTLPTEVELAERHGVTRTTVRRAFSLLVARGLVAKQQGRGSFVAEARAVVERSNSVVLIAAPRTLEVVEAGVVIRARRRYGYYHFLEAVISTLGEYGRQFHVHYYQNTPESLAAITHTVRTRNIVGAITFDVAERPTFDHMLSLGVPVVFFDSADFGCSVDIVNPDNRQSTRELVTHMLRTSPGLFACMAGSSARHIGFPQYERVQGFLMAHRDLARPFHQDSMVYGDLTNRFGREAMALLLQKSPRPTGIFCTDDEMGIGVIEELNGQGIRIPEEICVAGYGNGLYSFNIRPTLTSVDFDYAKLGRTAVELLEERLREPHGTPRTITVPSTILYRQSTAPLMAGL